MNISDLIAVGELIKPQGIKGEVKVLPLTDDPDRFGKLKRVYLKSACDLKELKIEKYRIFKQFVLLQFAGITDLTQAESLGRGLICIPRGERLKLPSGRYYRDEIEGLQVYTVSGKWLGKIEEIIETGSNDVYVVRGDKGEILIPALKTIVHAVELERSKMVVELPEGLAEDD